MVQPFATIAFGEFALARILYLCIDARRAMQQHTIHISDKPMEVDDRPRLGRGPFTSAEMVGPRALCHPGQSCSSSSLDSTFSSEASTCAKDRLIL